MNNYIIAYESKKVNIERVRKYMKVAFYGRYSSTNQNEQSIEGQLHVCEKYAKDNGLEIVAQYVDRAKSGKSAKRPEFQRMITDSEKGLFDGVLVYKLDRFARNRFDSVVYKRKLRDNGVKVISATEIITDSPEGIVMESLLEGMDEYYSAELARKMRRGKQESFNKGKYPGATVPFGYKLVNRKLEIDESTAQTVVEIFKRYAGGEPTAKIADWLNANGFRNHAGAMFDRYSVARILKHKLYTGVCEYKGLDGIQECPEIIDNDLFETVQRIFEERNSMSRKKRIDYNFILSGKLYCSECGKQLTVVNARKESNNKYRYHYYYCQRCKSKVLDAGKLHRKVLNTLAEYLTPEKLDELANGAYDAYKQETGTSSEIPRLEKELQDTERRLQNAVNAILEGVELDTLKDTIETLKAHRNDVRRQLEHSKQAMPELTFEMFRFILEEIVTQSPEKLLSAVVNRIVTDGKAVTIYINLTDTAKEPPLDSVLIDVKSCKQMHPYIKFSGQWMILSA